MAWVPLAWLTSTLVLLLLIERWIHRHLQGVAMLMTGDRDLAVVLYALPLLPGVLLHELSHALAAVVLRVRIGRISVRLKLSGRHIRLGFVPVERADPVRASLIGLAPLLTGSATILLIGTRVFLAGEMGSALATGDWASAATGLVRAFEASDAWIWAYIVFSVSNTMLPSRSDRQAWVPVILFVLLLGMAAWGVGLGPALVESLAEPFVIALRWLATMCTLALAFDLPFALLILLGEKLLDRVRGMEVAY